MIEAQEMLKAMQIADFPHTQKSKREKIHRDLHKKAYPKTYSKPVSTEDLARIIFGGNPNG